MKSCAEDEALRCIQIATSVSDEASGITYAVTRLSEALASQCLDVSVFSVGQHEARILNKVTYRSFAADSFGFIQNRLSPSSHLNMAVREAMKTPGIMHMHGLWRMPNVYPGRYVKKQNPLIVSPHGMLGAEALKFSAHSKKIFWHLLQRRTLQEVCCFHATAESEINEILSVGLRGPIALIPNGIDVPLIASKYLVSTRVHKDDEELKLKTLLHLGRIHPKKGLANLLQAWSLIQDDEPEWELKIVGPTENNHLSELRRLSLELDLQRVSFNSALFGLEKQRAYAAADLFILPTLHENFGLVVAEALAQGTPVICTKGAPWSGLIEHKCGWWVDQSPEALATALRTAFQAQPDTLAEMGERGRAWMMRDFSWSQVGSRMHALYRWCMGRDEKPRFVVSD